ncbi:MAG: YggT family protein [Candidatus Omnitrophica bacterium]|nr:YggT family protein [Candidatus Omnitrophota bacterium]MBU4487981.1 YggT family protein [Candidatus Omnitrophota bacterium]MCG2704776.1 YggT family protein [Candidatus Omnitrophota bacterium]
MFILGNFFIAVAKVLDIIIPLAYWLIVIRAVLSWFSPDPYNFLVQLLYKTTEPILTPFRRIMPAYSVGLDISPILAILALVFLRYFLVTTLYQLGRHFGGM